MSMRRKGFGIVFFVVLGALALSWVVMFLWNFSVAPTMGVGQLTYLQAMALLILMRILVGGFRFGSSMRRGPGRWGRWRDKWKGMSDEERDKLKQEWKNRCRT